MAKRNLCYLLDNYEVKVALWIPDDNEEIKKDVPKAEEEVHPVERRDTDSRWAMQMGKLAIKVLSCLEMAGNPANHEASSRAGDLCFPPCQQLSCLNIGQCCHDNELKRGSLSSQLKDRINTIKKQIDLEISSPLAEDLKGVFGLLETINTALDIVQDLGHEATIRFTLRAMKEQKESLNSATECPYFEGFVAFAKNYAALAMCPQAGVPMPVECRNFPRFAALVTILEKYRGTEQFHGMVFVRTRAAAMQLAEMLGKTPQLDFLTVSTLVGHGKTKKGQGLGLESERAGKGMTPSMQDRGLVEFKNPGEKLLVATNAAEEGINVMTCQLVVRYSVTETGIERIQSRGRARREGARYIDIVEKSSPEHMRYEKSKKEEKTMYEVLKNCDKILMIQ